MQPSHFRSLSKFTFILIIATGICGLSNNRDAKASPTHNPPGDKDYRKNPAEVTDHSRSPEYNDFVRVVWPSVGGNVTSITFGKRGFFTAATFLKPPVTVDELLTFIGNFFHQNRDFAVMRCKPSPEQRLIVQPILATWPNVFPAIVNDYGGPEGNCSQMGLSEAQKELCKIAAHYNDEPHTIYDFGLAKTLRRGAQMLATQARRDALNNDYGIFPQFSGLGFTVQASATNTGDVVPMTTAEILRNSVVPEYLLKNAPLADAGCRCVQVPGTESLHHARVSMEFVWKYGELDNGACRKLGELDDGDARREILN